jgi:molybdenum cofactor synthesis domain-containing protein
MQLMGGVDTGTEPKRQGGAVQLAIVSQGEELLGGETVDTNSAWLAAQSSDLGIPTRRMVTAGDSIEDICWALGEAAEAADVILCTGGLGPTQDDLTAQAVARWAGISLERRPDALAQIEELFARWDRKMDPINAKQADLPQGALILPNPMGTAPGFSLQHSGVHLFCMPGVPREMRPMFTDHVAARLSKLQTGAPPITHRIRTIGIPESRLQQLLGPLDLESATLGFRSHLPEVIVKLVFPPNTPEPMRTTQIDAAVAAIGRGVYSVDGGDLAQTVGQRLEIGRAHV